MRIAFVSAIPFTQREANRRDAEIASLAKAFVSLRHEVCLIAPLPSGADVGGLSLARRLNPIKIDIGDQTIFSTRYDGRTSSGIEIHLVEADETWFDAANGVVKDSKYVEVLPRAALQILGSFKTKMDCCVSWNADASLVPALDVEQSPEPTATTHILSISTLEGDSEALNKGLMAAHRVAIYRSVATSEKAKRIEPIAAITAHGRTATISRPVDSRRNAGEKAKASAKAACQLGLNLPVRQDVPLVFFAEPTEWPFAEALRVFLKGRVQAIARSADKDLEALAERYPDRLAVIPASDVSEDLLFAVDGCAVGSDPYMTSLAMACGAVPVAGPACSADLVDLDPSLESGSGIAIGHWSPKGAVEALSRLTAAFQTGPSFKALASRLPGYVNTWSDTAELYLQLIEEAAR